jgi:peptidoglycan/LPS O-acetylase OafA/YrhL
MQLSIRKKWGNMQKGKINLDIELLRGIAILIVLIQHFPSLYFWSQHDFANDVNKYVGFWSGVDLFFCISGFVVCTTILKKIDIAKNTNISTSAVIKQFFIKRIFRILPTSWLWVLLCVLLSVVYNKSGAFGSFYYTFIQAIGVFTYTFNAMPTYMNQHGIPLTLAPYWSLTLEEQFYFIFPFFLLFTTTKRRILILLSLIAIQFFITRQGYFIFNFRLDAISWGVLLCILSNEYSGYYCKFEPVSLLKKKFLLVTLTGVLLLMLTFSIGILSQSRFLVGFLAITCAVFVYLASFNKGYIYCPRHLKPILLWIGSRSFGIYIIHMPVIYLVQESTVRVLIHLGVGPTNSAVLISTMSAVTLLLLITLVEINYKLIEVPFRNYGRSKAEKIVTIFKMDSL